jgi:hypothetical protein
MAFVATDPLFQVPGVFPVHQHILAIIGFEKRGVTLNKMTIDLLATIPYVCKYANVNAIIHNHETMGVTSVV